MEEWDARPREVTFKGRELELFTRGHLAKALNRKVVTIRRMERTGVLIHPRLRNRHGVWLYTRAQVEALVQLAAEEGVLDPAKRAPYSPRFIREAHRVLHEYPQ